MARQNRTTLVADVPQELASSEMLRQATPAGSSRTIWATRRSTGARFGSSARMVTRIPTSGPPSGRPWCWATPSGYRLPRRHRFLASWYGMITPRQQQRGGQQQQAGDRERGAQAGETGQQPPHGGQGRDGGGGGDGPRRQRAGYAAGRRLVQPVGGIHRVEHADGGDQPQLDHHDLRQPGHARPDEGQPDREARAHRAGGTRSEER